MDLLSYLINGKRTGFKRLSVDQGNTGFFEGLEFRTFKEWQNPISGIYVMKVVTTIDVILWELSASVDEGHLRVETLVGGTEGGTFSETLPKFPANAMSDRAPDLNLNSIVTITAGGTLTGGTLIDVFHVKTQDNSNQSISVGGSIGKERGVAAGTYYFRLTFTNASAILKARWEERR